jgi:hypothetical protein
VCGKLELYHSGVDHSRLGPRFEFVQLLDLICVRIRAVSKLSGKLGAALYRHLEDDPDVPRHSLMERSEVLGSPPDVPNVTARVKWYYVYTVNNLRLSVTVCMCEISNCAGDCSNLLKGRLPTGPA